jgi:hypothetical protein
MAAILPRVEIVRNRLPRESIAHTFGPARLEAHRLEKEEPMVYLRGTARFWFLLILLGCGSNSPGPSDAPIVHLTDGGPEAAPPDAAADAAPVDAPEPDAQPVDGRVMVPMAAVPAPWKSDDVGLVAVPGGAGVAMGRYFVRGSGTDIFGTNDGFTFLSRPVSGDMEIVARVVGLEAINPDVKAGVMVRESTASDARHACMLVFPAVPSATGAGTMGKGTRLQFRDKRAELLSLYADLASLRPDAPDAPPIWLRLQRKGSLLTGSISGDGQTWIKDGEATIALPAGVLAGLAVTSFSADDATVGVFENVRVTALTDPQWSHTEVGTLGGYAAGAPARFEVGSAGPGLADGRDGVTFVHRGEPLIGDVEITGRVSVLSTDDPQPPRVGFMLRQGLGPGARMAAFVVEPAPGGVRALLLRRTGDDGPLAMTVAATPPPDGGAPDASAGTDGGPLGPTLAAPVWIKLVRVGSQFAGLISRDGVTYQRVAYVAGVNIAVNAYTGLVATSGTDRAAATATVETVTIVSPPTTVITPDAGVDARD